MTNRGRRHEGLAWAPVASENIEYVFDTSAQAGPPAAADLQLDTPELVTRSTGAANRER